MNPTEKTVSYYDDNADSFLADTANVEFGELQRAFASMLPEGGRILDLGCGSGRDSLEFLKKGFCVDAVDGSAQMAQAARKATGLPVAHALFADYEPQNTYDGIWACSSLLHVAKDELPALITKYAVALKPGGVFYLSFKLGTHEGMRNGRWFTDMTEDSIRSLMANIDDLCIQSISITTDVRPGRETERWLNIWCVKEKAKS